MKIKWINQNEDDDPTIYGVWRSLEGRFTISPQFRSTVRPDSYCVRDNLKEINTSRDTVRECKQWALDKIIEELN